MEIRLSNAVKAILGICAGLGFFGGFMWGVVGSSPADAVKLFVEATAPSAALASVVYVGLLGFFFLPKAVRCAKLWFTSGAPAAFGGSFIIGALGIRSALWLMA